MKKALSLLIAFGAMSLMSVSAYAATYAVESTTANAGDTVTLTIKASADDTSSTVNGYALDIAYDDSVLTPVVVDNATDLTGADLYATDKTGDGIIVASPVTVDDKSCLAVAWANTTAKELSVDGTELATITFKVADDTTATSTDLSIAVVANAVDATTLATTTETQTGTVTLGETVTYYYGDATKNGIIDSDDADLVIQWALNGDGYTELEKKIVNVDGNSVIDSNDVELIIQRALNGSSYEFAVGKSFEATE